MSLFIKMLESLGRAIFQKECEPEPRVVKYLTDGRIVIHEIPCYDEESLGEFQKERELVQKLINQIIKKYDVIITGTFVEEAIDEENKNSIKSEIKISDCNLNKINQRKKLKFKHFYMNNFNINNDLFMAVPYDFRNITIWKKEKFDESLLIKSKFSQEDISKVLFSLSIVEEYAISFTLAKELSKYAEEFKNKLQDIGYKIKEVNKKNE